MKPFDFIVRAIRNDGRRIVAKTEAMTLQDAWVSSVAKWGETTLYKWQILEIERA